MRREAAARDSSEEERRSSRREDERSSRGGGGEAPQQWEKRSVEVEGEVTNGIILCVCSTLAISVLQIVLKRCQKKRKKNQVKSHSEVKTNDEFDCKGTLNSVIFCIRKPGEEKL